MPVLALIYLFATGWHNVIKSCLVGCVIIIHANHRWSVNILCLAGVIVDEVFKLAALSRQCRLHPSNFVSIYISGWLYPDPLASLHLKLLLLTLLSVAVVEVASEECGHHNEDYQEHCSDGGTTICFVLNFFVAEHSQQRWLVLGDWFGNN